MVARIRPRTCRWPRFSRYEFRDARIVPAPGAKVHMYDPWRDYVRSKSETRGQPPYMALASLVDTLKKEFHAAGWSILESAGIPPALSDSSKQAILTWTSQHGLLGVFHQTTAQIEDPGADRVWTRAGGRWHQLPKFPRLEAPVPVPVCLASSVIGAPDLEARGSHAHLLKFLGPQIPTEMPAPDSEEFFAAYGEPLWDWIVAAITTVDAIFERDDETLNVLAGAAARVRRFEGDDVRSRIVFPSLLSGYAEMVFQDFEVGNLLGKCASCGSLFITDRKWTKHCSERCATKERQRRFNERNPEYYRRAHRPHTSVRSNKKKVAS